MKYLGHFTLIHPQDKRQQYAVTFSVDGFESPGYRLRRIVFEEFGGKDAAGLSIDLLEALDDEIVPEAKHISIRELSGNMPLPQSLQDLDLAY